MGEFIEMVFHHGGKFARDARGVLSYVNGKVSKLPKVDVDLVCLPDIISSFKGLGYHAYGKCYWCVPKPLDFETSLKIIRGDEDINDMCNAALVSRNQIDIYFVHPILKGEVVEGERKNDRKGQQVDKNNEVEKEGDGSKNDKEYDCKSEDLHTPTQFDEDDGHSRPTFPQFNLQAAFGAMHLEHGMEFKNLEQFKPAVKDYNIHLGREVRWLRTHKVRAKAIWLETCHQPEDNVSQPYNFDACSQTGNSASVTQPESDMENLLPQPTQIQTAVRIPQYVMENPLPQPTQIQTDVGRPQSIMVNPLPQPTQDSEAPLLPTPGLQSRYQKKN